MKISIDTIDGKTHVVDVTGETDFSKFTDGVVGSRFICDDKLIIQTDKIVSISLIKEETE
jgi:hypothetical protein